MSDVLSPEQRKYCMSKIRGKDTGPEIKLRKLLWSNGFRYRLKNKLPGRPDIIYPRKKIAIFIDGCFWHKCPKHFKEPLNNPDFWRLKIDENVKRDTKVNKLLDEMGWIVLRYWEHEILSEIDTVLSKISITLNVRRDQRLY